MLAQAVARYYRATVKRRLTLYQILLMYDSFYLLLETKEVIVQQQSYVANTMLFAWFYLILAQQSQAQVNFRTRARLMTRRAKNLQGRYVARPLCSLKLVKVCSSKCFASTWHLLIGFFGLISGLVGLELFRSLLGPKDHGPQALSLLNLWLLVAQRAQQLASLAQERSFTSGVAPGLRLDPKPQSLQLLVAQKAQQYVSQRAKAFGSWWPKGTQLSALGSKGHP